jgi:hypothetical protein
MATIKLQGSSGGGSVTLTAPVTAANRTITLPDQDVNLGNVGAAVVGTLNGTGTIALYNTKGVSSATDNGVGMYQFNFSSNFSTATYYSCGTCCYQLTGYWEYLANNFTGGNQDYTRTTSYCKAGSYDGSYVDAPSIGLMASA